MSDYAFPEFFLVGAPKCGTTTIHSWLSRHPDIHLPIKEPGFFCQDILDTSRLPTHIENLDVYLEKVGAPIDSGKIAGDLTPKYLYSDQALKAIATLNPKAKIIVCLRHPVEIVISMHNQKLLEGVEKEPSLEKAWKRSCSINSKDKEAHEPQLNYLMWGSVGSRIKELFTLFDRSNILIILLQDIQEQPMNVYQQILHHIEVPDDGYMPVGFENERRGIKSIAVHKLMHKLFSNPMMQNATHYLWQRRSGRGFGVLRFIHSMNTNKGQYSNALSVEFRTHLREALSDETELAESYLADRKLAISNG